MGINIISPFLLKKEFSIKHIALIAINHKKNSAVKTAELTGYANKKK